MQIALIVLIISAVVITIVTSFPSITTKILSTDTRPKSVYKKRPSVMNKSEEAFFFELKKQLPEGYYIFPKMRIADILETVSGKDYYLLRNKILPKHIDFLICDSYFKPVVAIEVNGGYHNTESQKEKDSIKREIFSNAKLSFETVNVGTDFSESIAKIKESLVSI